jgi:hypothetical protein
MRDRMLVTMTIPGTAQLRNSLTASQSTMVVVRYISCSPAVQLGSIGPMNGLMGHGAL